MLQVSGHPGNVFTVLKNRHILLLNHLDVHRRCSGQYLLENPRVFGKSLKVKETERLFKCKKAFGERETENRPLDLDAQEDSTAKLEIGNTKQVRRVSGRSSTQRSLSE